MLLPTPLSSSLYSRPCADKSSLPTYLLPIYMEDTGLVVCKGSVYVWSLANESKSTLIETMEREKSVIALLVMAPTLYVTMASVYTVKFVH